MAQTRKNKSHKLANSLKRMGNTTVNVNNPFAKEMADAAKHIEWLELILTGISYADRNTIAKLTRKVGMQKVMIDKRDVKIRLHGMEIKKLKEVHRNITGRTAREHKAELVRAGRISQEDRHQIERDFIKDLQTGFQKGNELAKARWEGRNEYRSSSTSNTVNHGWRSVISTNY